MVTSSILAGKATGKLFKAALLFWTLKGSIQLAIASILLAVALFVVSTIFDAVSECSHHIAEVWTQADGITRLAMLILAVLFIRVCAPVALKVYRKGSL